MRFRVRGGRGSKPYENPKPGPRADLSRGSRAAFGTLLNSSQRLLGFKALGL